MGRSSPSLRTPTREHCSNLTVGTLFSNSRLVSLYQPLRFSKFWDLRSWHLGLARIKHALVASLLVMIRTHVHDVLLLRRRKNAPLVRTNVLPPHHPLPFQLTPEQAVGLNALTAEQWLVHCQAVRSNHPRTEPEIEQFLSLPIEKIVEVFRGAVQHLVASLPPTDPSIPTPTPSTSTSTPSTSTTLPTT